MNNKWKIILGGTIMIICLLILFIVEFKVLPEGVKRQQIVEQKIEFDICLQGCKFYENAIPYINNSRVVYFDFCAGDCRNKYMEEKNDIRS